MICKKCGTENADYASACAKCGNPLKVASKPKSNLFDFSLCSGLMLVFCVLALVFLILPSTRSLSFSESEGKMPIITGKDAVGIMRIVRDNLSIESEVARIKERLEPYEALEKEKDALQEKVDRDEDDDGTAAARLEEVEKEMTDMSDTFAKEAVWVQEWSPEDAIAILEGIDPTDPKGYIAGIKQRDEAHKAADNAHKVEAREELDSYILEAMDAQDDDLVDRGAIGAVIREHRGMKEVSNTLLVVMCILLAVSLIITIVSWVTKLYRIRIIAAIANAVLALFAFIVPLAAWSFETKWPFEVSQYITYGVTFGSTFIWVFVFSFATLFTALAYFADDLFGKKN